MFRHSDTGNVLLIIFVLATYATVFLLRKKIKYFTAPANVIKKETRNNIFSALHIFPSIILAFLTVLKVLPIIPYFEHKLEENNIVIPVFILMFFFVFSFMIGLLIEKIIEKNNEEFRKWKCKI